MSASAKRERTEARFRRFDFAQRRPELAEGRGPAPLRSSLTSVQRQTEINRHQALGIRHQPKPDAWCRVPSACRRYLMVSLSITRSTPSTFLASATALARPAADFTVPFSVTT
jgi:hypothetical protein